MWQQYKKLWLYIKYLNKVNDITNVNVKPRMKRKLINMMQLDIVDEDVTFYQFAAWYEVQIEALRMAEYTYPYPKK